MQTLPHIIGEQRDCLPTCESRGLPKMRQAHPRGVLVGRPDLRERERLNQRMEIDLFAQDNMRLQEMVDTALAAPFTPEEGQVEKAIYASLLTLGVKTVPLLVDYYLYQGNWFDTAVAATLMALPVLILSVFRQHYLREMSLASVMR